MSFLKRKRLKILLLISICVNSSFVIIQFFIHHQDKSLQSRIEIYQTIDGDHGRDNRAGSRNLKDKEDLAIEHDIAAPVNAESKDQNKIQLKLKYLKEDVNSMLAITSVPLAARDFRRLKPVVSKVNNYSDEFCPEGGENLGMLAYILLVCFSAVALLFSAGLGVLAFKA